MQSVYLSSFKIMCRLFVLLDLEVLDNGNNDKNDGDEDKN